MEDQTVKEGVVSSILYSKNFGFIVSEEVEYFFHDTACLDFESLNPGDKVKFTPVKTAKGWRAVGVRNK